MRFHIRLVLDDQLHVIQWSTDVYGEQGRKLRTVIRAPEAPDCRPGEALDEALADLALLYKHLPDFT
jgi:hypothetical protein